MATFILHICLKALYNVPSAHSHSHVRDRQSADPTGMLSDSHDDK